MFLFNSSRASVRLSFSNVGILLKKFRNLILKQGCKSARMQRASKYLARIVQALRNLVYYLLHVSFMKLPVASWTEKLLVRRAVSDLVIVAAYFTKIVS